MSRCTSCFYKRQKNQRSNFQHPLDHRKCNIIPENIYLCFIDYAKAFDYVDHNELWKILKEIGIPDHLTCLLRNLYAGQEATVRTGHETMDWFKIGKGVRQGCILSSCLFNIYVESIMRNAGLDKAQAGIKTARRNNNLTYEDDTTLMGRKQRGNKEPFDESERGEWKSWLKAQHSKNEDHEIQSHHFMASRRGRSRSSDRFYFLELQNHCGGWPHPRN